MRYCWIEGPIEAQWIGSAYDNGRQWFESTAFGLTKASQSRTSIGTIVRTTEPDFGLAECFRTHDVCLFESECALQHALNDSLTAFFKVLDGLTLDDLVRNQPKVFSNFKRTAARKPGN